MNQRRSKTPRLLRTPIHHIPIGVPLKKIDGRYVLQIKKPNGPEYEELSLDSLISMVVTEAETNNGNTAGNPLMR